MNNVNSKPSNKGHRIWILVVIAVLASGGFLALQLSSEMDRNLKSWLSLAIILLSLLLTALWYILLSRYQGRYRVIAALGLIVLVAAFKIMVRVDGTASGIGTPHFVWKWTPQHEAAPVIKATSGGADVPTPTGAKDATQYYGSKRDGTVLGASLVKDWNSSPPKQLWRQAIGEGWSAFAVVGGRAYTQEQRGEDELVTCYELLTGRILWSHADKVRFSQWQSGDGPHGTPAYDNGKLYSLGGTGVLNCLDAITGKLVWSHDVLKENALPNLLWGISCSPLVVDDRVVVTGGDAAGPSLFAYHKDTGAPLWKSGTDKCSYSSPLLATILGKRSVITLNASTLTLTDPTSGALLVEYKWVDGKWPIAAQPTVIGTDRIFLTAGYGMGCVMLQFKADAEGKLSVSELWKNNKLKAQFNSVAVRDGYIYGLDDGSAASVEIATGTRKWKEGRFGSGQSLLVDDLLIVPSEQGPVILTEAKPDGYQELGRIPALSSKTWNHPVLAGRYLLVRNDREAVCYELPENGLK